MRLRRIIARIFSDNGYSCAVCGNSKILKKVFDSDLCLYCKKNTCNNINLKLHENVTVHDSGKILRYVKSKTEYLSLNIFGWFPSHEYKNGVNKEQVLDKENDYYKEQLKDQKTGRILYKCEEPLSKHIGHGSAKDKNH